MIPNVAAGSSSAYVGALVGGGTANSVLFVGSTGLLAQDNPGLTYDASTNRLSVATSILVGTTLLIVDNGSNNYAIGGTTTNIVSFDATKFVIRNGAGTLSMETFDFGTAGQGPQITSGTATTDVAALSVTRTNNNAAVATGVKFAFTDTSSAAGFEAFGVYGGAAAATKIFSLGKTGQMFAGTLTAAAGTPNSICQNDATKEITVNAALTCTVSSARFKDSIAAFGGGALDMLAKVNASTFVYKDRLDRKRMGLIAENLAEVDPRLAEWDGDKPNSIDFSAMFALMTKGMQEINTRMQRAGI